MTDPSPSSSGSDIAAELQQLGQNLLSALKLVWESEERKRAQADVEKGLSDMADSLRKAANDFSQTPTGQNLKNDFEDLRQRVETGQVESQVRSEVLSALQSVNSELKRAMDKHRPADENPTEPSQNTGG